MFTGIEAEGAYKGIKTLFVQMSEIRYPDNLLPAARREGVHHIYLGAKGDHAQQSESEHRRILLAIATEPQFREFLWTIETPVQEFGLLPAALMATQGVRILASIKATVPTLDRALIEVKLDGPTHCLIFGAPSQVDTTYTQDKEI